MAKPYSVSNRVAFAFGIAVTADLIQFWINPHAGIWALLGEIGNVLIDCFVLAATTILLGFNWVLMPSLFVEVIPGLDLFPTWTACVAYLVWSQKRKAENQPQTLDANGAGETRPFREKPRLATLSAAMFPARPGSSGLLYLVATVALIAGLIWYMRRTSPPEPVKLSWPNWTTNPVVVVGHIDNQATSNSSRRSGQAIASFERIRTYIEEMLRGVGGVEVWDKQQAQAFLSQWEQNRGGQSGAQNAEKPRMTASHFVVVLVAILDRQDAAANFKGYGITEKSLDTQCSLRLQVMNATNGSVTFSRILSGSKTQTQTEFVQLSSTEDRGFEAIKAALEKLENDADFRSAVRGGKADEQVEVEFSPKPENCDIKIDGRYVGGSPLKINLLSGHETKVRISKAGFMDWEGRLLPQAGLRVTRELEPVESKRQTP